MNVETTDDVIRIAIDLSVPPKRVWTLLTEEPHIANWWGSYVELQARPGGKLRETWSDGAREIVTSGEVTRCDPPFALEMTWADDDWSGDTTVAFHLTEGRDGTHLVLTHAGWTVHAADQRHALIDGHARGWSEHLTRLAAYATEEERGGTAAEEARN